MEYQKALQRIALLEAQVQPKRQAVSHGVSGPLNFASTADNSSPHAMFGAPPNAASPPPAGSDLMPRSRGGTFGSNIVSKRAKPEQTSKSSVEQLSKIHTEDTVSHQIHISSNQVIPGTDVESDDVSPKLPKVVSDFNPVINNDGSGRNLVSTPTDGTNLTPVSPMETRNIIVEEVTPANNLFETDEKYPENPYLQFENRDSNFSLSNVAEFDDGRVKPLPHMVHEDASSRASRCSPQSAAGGTSRAANPFSFGAGEALKW